MGPKYRFFKWVGGSEGDFFSGLGFSNCVFIEDIGPFKKGDKVDSIFISFKKSKMSVYKDGKETCFALTLNAVPIEAE